MSYNYTENEVLIEVKNIKLSLGGVRILDNISLEIKDIIQEGQTRGQVRSILGPSGVGKCLSPKTRILMFNGEVKTASEIRVGDKLMGPDSCPRVVLNRNDGYGNMFKIVPVKGIPWECNGDHILSLIKSRTGKIVDISLKEYLKWSKNQKNLHKLFKVPIEFKPEEDQLLPIPPYYIGIWLGDGTKHFIKNGLARVEVCKPEEEIKQAVIDTALYFDDRYNCYNPESTDQKHVIVCSNTRKRKISNALVAMRKLFPKGREIEIPSMYLFADRNSRLELLAGLLDTDGHLIHNCFEIAQKRKSISVGIEFLARSLGFNVTTTIKIVKGKRYFRMFISGETSMIPTRILRKKAQKRKQIKNVLHTGFTIQKLVDGAYVGFTLDGDGRFLLEDFTVTHNSCLMRILTGLLKPDSGSVSISPHGNDAILPVEPGMIGMVAQNYPLFAHLTLLENCIIGASESGLSHKNAREKSREMLDRFSLYEHRNKFPSKLSGGQRQRGAIIQQILVDRRYMVLDEPFSGLDPVSLNKLLKLIIEITTTDEYNTFIIITHDISAALRISDHVHVLGRTFDVEHKILRAGHIVESINLMDEGIAWRPDIRNLPKYSEILHHIEDKFIHV